MNIYKNENEFKKEFYEKWYDKYDKMSGKDALEVLYYTQLEMSWNNMTMLKYFENIPIKDFIKIVGKELILRLEDFQNYNKSVGEFITDHAIETFIKMVKLQINENIAAIIKDICNRDTNQNYETFREHLDLSNAKIEFEI